MLELLFESVNESNIVYNSFNIFTIFIAPSASVFAEQYCPNPTIPEKSSVTQTYLRWQWRVIMTAGETKLLSVDVHGDMEMYRKLLSSLM